MTNAPTITDYLWTFAIIAGMAVIAVLSVVAANRREAELRAELEQEHDHGDDGEIPPFRILGPRPYNWTDELDQ